MNFTTHLRGTLISKLVCDQYILALLVSNQRAKFLGCVIGM